LLDQVGRVRPYLQEARRRGVKFDVGHGGGSFHFRNAEPAVSQGFWPDSISTDVHLGSMNGPMIDMPTVMSKFLALGVPLDEVVRLSTAEPAKLIKRPALGQIKVGSEADLAVFRLQTGHFNFMDVVGGTIEGTQRLGCEMTIRAGKIVFDNNGHSGVPWREGEFEYPLR
jgi:dihydroorotase